MFYFALLNPDRVLIPLHPSFLISKMFNSWGQLRSLLLSIAICSSLMVLISDYIHHQEDLSGMKRQVLRRGFLKHGEGKRSVTNPPI